jgi:hypothetical protein
LDHAPTDPGAPWKKKKDILREQSQASVWDAGWRFVLASSSEDGKTMGSVTEDAVMRGKERPRMNIPYGKDIREYEDWLRHAQQDEESAYYGESGTTLETRIMAYMLYLEEKGGILAGSTFCLGSRFRNPDNGKGVVIGYSSSDEAISIEVDIEGDEGSIGLATEVRI